MDCTLLTEQCAQLADDSVCSVTQATYHANRDVTVNVLSCGPGNEWPLVAYSGVVKKASAPACGSPRGVPAYTVVMADCWDTYSMVASCGADGRWRHEGENGVFK